MGRKDRGQDRRRDNNQSVEGFSRAELAVAEQTLDAPGGSVTVREVKLDDISRLVDYEIEIARISFPRDPMVDPDAHDKKLRKAIERGEPGMIVLDRGGRAVAWLWITINTNFLTAEHYATFRSMAADENEPDGPALAQLLFDFGIAYARRLGLQEITGKVHVNNVRMRLLYRQAGFESEHLTMKMYLDA